MNRFKSFGLGCKQLVHEANDTNLSIFAGSLVYITLLSLVPTLALSFSVLHAFGIQNQLDPLLVELLSPIGDHADQLVDGILQFVNNTNVEMLGIIGVGMILYSGISMVLKLEFAFNHIWQVTETRSLVKRISFYLAMLLLGPVVLFLSMAFMGAIDEIPFFQSFLAFQYFSIPYYFLINIVPFLLITFALFALYYVLPNYSVSARFAAYSAMITAFVWKLLGWGFSSFIATSVNYNVIYSGFAVVVLFIFWVYLTWLSILIGTMICSKLQYRASPRLRNVSSQKSRLLRLCLLLRIYPANAADSQPVSIADLASDAQIPINEIMSLVNDLKHENRVDVEIQCGKTWVHAKADLSGLSLGQLLELVDFPQSLSVEDGMFEGFAAELSQLRCWYAKDLKCDSPVSEIRPKV